METLTYTAKSRKELETHEWAGRGDFRNAALRAIKLARPQCDQCQSFGLDTPLFWAKDCTHGPEQKGGSPYWRVQQHIRKVDSLVPIKDADGKETGEYTKGPVETRVTFSIEPNITEVPLSVRFASGEAVRTAREAKQYKLLEEVGVAPMCQMKGCGKAWPEYRTANGDYCSIEHAKLIQADVDENITAQVANNPMQQSKALDAIVI